MYRPDGKQNQPFAGELFFADKTETLRYRTACFTEQNPPNKRTVNPIGGEQN